MEYKVVIYQHGGKYWLAGGQLAIKKKDAVHFYNSTAHPAEVKGDKVWPDTKPLNIGSNGDGKVTFDDEGWFPYTVKIDGQEAEASKPIVIVYP
ncbi:MAG: hypothetical protein JSV52_10945 [Candidatus Zixiibacteriota bacterium]|nr:MAG: hypothetical protein JSV52_10945 [candidate division Zixibacteria bacterium]